MDRWCSGRTYEVRGGELLSPNAASANAVKKSVVDAAPPVCGRMVFLKSARTSIDRAAG